MASIHLLLGFPARDPDLFCICDNDVVAAISYRADHGTLAMYFGRLACNNKVRTRWIVNRFVLPHEEKCKAS